MLVRARFSISRVIAALMTLALQASVFAGWDDMREGLEAEEVIKAVGHPLMVQSARGFSTWTFDRGGYVMLEAGKVTGWSAPKEEGGR